jgi:DNA topoisomerase-3
VQQHTGDARWGAHAQRIASGEMWHPPRPGGNNDQAHPPIHPTRYTRGEASWPQEKARQPCNSRRALHASLAQAVLGR